jgi:hemoglobin
MEVPNDSIHAAIGSAPLADLAESLYRRIERDDRIRPMFSPDLGPQSAAVADMREFLIQFFGGPTDYSDRKGHPRLRARHMRFPIDQQAREAWLGHALSALDEVAARHALRTEIVGSIAAYLRHASQFMVNRPG